ncbi:MAG: septum formation protein Maf [Desulfuromonas sp.]|nr:MAG: septum formation protein Maf [Desulfuromonas sp.]
MRRLILASTSPYRRQLMTQLGLPFTAAAPRFEETLEQGIAPELLVRHLALRKAQSLREVYPGALIIGSDQVFVDPRERIHGKPQDREAAFCQLKAMVGRRHTFYTGIAICDAASGEEVSDCVSYAVSLRPLSDAAIHRYLDRERPFDCAGSFKVEGLGIALMQEMSGTDYTSLIGLPLIRLTQMLEGFGVPVLDGES